MCTFWKHVLRGTFSFLALSFVVLPGCREHSPDTAPVTDVVTLTYWPAPNPQEVAFADTIVRQWNRLHPRIQVRMQSIPVSVSTEEVLLAAIAGGTTPDICSNIWPGALHEYTRAGGLLRLDRFADFDSVARSRTPDPLLQTFRSPDGGFHQMPWKTNPVMMFYNRTLFEESGVELAPRTYSEYFAAAQKLTRDRNGDGIIDVWAGERDIRPIWWQRLFDVFPFTIAASGGRTLFEQGEPAFATPATEGVFAFFQRCYAEGYYPHTYFAGGDPFILEKKATQFSGPYLVATLQSLAPRLRFGVVPLPVPDDHTGPVHTYGDYKNIAIFTTTRYPAEAWEFVKFMVDARQDLLLLTVANQLPVRGDLLTNRMFASYFEKNPMIRSFAEQVPYTRGVDAAPDLKELFDALSQEYESCAVYGRKTPSQAVLDAQERIRAIVDWNR